MSGPVTRTMSEEFSTRVRQNSSGRSRLDSGLTESSCSACFGLPTTVPHPCSGTKGCANTIAEYRVTGYRELATWSTKEWPPDPTQRLRAESKLSLPRDGRTLVETNVTGTGYCQNSRTGILRAIHGLQKGAVDEACVL